MIRLTRLYIKGFKDEEREIDLHFSEEPISVIYGPNGSGKTTLLKVLQAVLKQDFRVLFRENVDYVKLEYTKDGQDCFLEAKAEKTHINPKNSTIKISDVTQVGFSKLIDGFIVNTKYITNGDTLVNTRSILLGIYRGIPIDLYGVGFKDFLNDLLIKSSNTFYQRFSELDAAPYIEEYITQMWNNYESIINQNNKNRTELSIANNHLEEEFVTIHDIRKSILENFEQGNIEVIEKAASAFFETIESFETMAEHDFVIDANIEKRINAKIDFIQSALKKQSPSNLKNRLEEYLKTFDQKALNGSKISRALLLNILEKAEEPNPALDAVNKLLEIFNANLHYGKKLVIDGQKVYIGLKGDKSHNLEDLSSGERSLLTMLTLALIMGQGREFLIIDEPEISMNLEWQRKFLPLLSELNPQTQIIVASHSPAIASNNSRYLVELK